MCECNDKKVIEGKELLRIVYRPGRTQVFTNYKGIDETFALGRAFNKILEDPGVLGALLLDIGTEKEKE